ncbi:hypothetical protein H1V43_38125 [Streptomyces sp. PSKA54]|uniref:Uncharacterized protein n=1 Tax=Streptomyces himalayensis subsp. aureolus TaxID=2758039 RepID=A0A7W2HKB8_9ACTN|nr:hypothetical protein [Streptomyces himalayensis]MBA4867015.1 hypothetical protein [Streptomyces himalayensis subsp. aureolus]
MTDSVARCSAVVERGRHASLEDSAGRRGIGLAFVDGDDRDVWVFNRKTLHYLGSDEVALLDVGVVDKIGKTPGE